MRIRWKWKILLPLFLLLLLIPGSVSDASQKRRTGTGQVVEIPDKWTAFTGNINTHKEPELKILIAGNSLSGLNDMGETLQKLAQAGGHRIQVEVLWKNGCPLYRYASASHTMGKRLRRLLKSQEWDYVILQENTPNVISEDSSVPKAAQRLSKLIRKYGAEPMFLETWAPEEGHKVYKKAGKNEPGIRDLGRGGILGTERQPKGGFDRGGLQTSHRRRQLCHGMRLLHDAFSGKNSQLERLCKGGTRESNTADSVSNVKKLSFLKKMREFLLI